jgi:DNA-binding MarR family transcriptional regulator
VVDAVLAASRALVAVAARSLAAAPGDVTLPQYRVLVVLTTRGPQRSGELAAELGVAPSSVTRLCDRLVRKGLITRQDAPDSRREVEIAATAEGRALVQRVMRTRRREIEKLVAAVPENRRAAMVEALRELADAAGEAPEPAWTLGWPG